MVPMQKPECPSLVWPYYPLYWACVEDEPPAVLTALLRNEQTAALAN